MAFGSNIPVFLSNLVAFSINFVVLSICIAALVKSAAPSFYFDLLFQDVMFSFDSRGILFGCMF